ncbi:hypothetical protein [Streptomyces sp. NPDC059786]|uniref:hypothetical protein n=1 Tax=Streptomyces sp. NPDC059786 TaxID=3346946 RepID=UPI003654C984
MSVRLWCVAPPADTARITAHLSAMRETRLSASLPGRTTCSGQRPASVPLNRWDSGTVAAAEGRLLGRLRAAHGG